MSDLKIVKGIEKHKMTSAEALSIMEELRGGPVSNVEYLKRVKASLVKEIGSKKYKDAVNQIEVSEVVLEAFDFAIQLIKDKIETEVICN